MPSIDSRFPLLGLCLIATVLAAMLVTVPVHADEFQCATLDIDRAGAPAVESLRAASPLWLEMDDVFFVCGAAQDFESLTEPQTRRIGQRWQALERGDLFIVRAAHPGRIAYPNGVSVLTRGGPYAVVEAQTDEARRRLQRGLWTPHEHASGHDEPAINDGCQRPHIEPVQESRVLARQSANAATRGSVTFSPAVADAVAAVDFDRWFADVETLAGWNRFTRGDEIDDASAWLVSQFTALGLPVETPTFQVGATTANNVIATWTGTTRPDDWFIVGAHYDSVSQDPFNAAPGAEDNASGCAGVLELARILVPRQPESTILFMCYSGEEQGLFGSDDHAGGLVASGDASKLVEVQTMDMIGYSGDVDLDVLLETEPAFASILDLYVDAAAAFTTLRTVESLNAFGSDHVPYLNRNLPALLTIENDWDSYSDYHRTTDLPANINRQMGGQIVQMNAAVLAHQAGLGALGAIFADGFESGNVSAWSTAQP